MVVSGTVITLPSLGQDVQLGMLYNARTSELFAGISLWDNDVVNAKQTKDENRVQNAEFSFSTSIEDSRKNSSLDVEGSLTLDLKMVQATGSAKYLSDTKSSTHEARLHASCTVTRWTRRIPQETLSSMKYQRNLDDPRFTHFVAEVVEGGSATISFVRSASSDEEAKQISGELKITLVGIPVSGSAKVDYKDVSQENREKVKISYSGAIAENVSTWEDARRVATEMPTKLAKQENTLYYKLLPLDLLDSNVNRLIRSLDASTVTRTAVAIKTGTKARLRLDELLEHQLLHDAFPVIKAQIGGFRDAFLAGESTFMETARRLLPELRDGNTDYNSKVTELQSAVSLFEQRVQIAEQFADLKQTELDFLQSQVTSLFDQGFQNHLGKPKPGDLTTVSAPRVLLSFGGARINRLHHPLEKKVLSTELANASGGEDEEEEEEDDVEWFESATTLNSVRGACAELISARSRAPAEVLFGVAIVDKAYRPGKTKLTKTSIGDIVIGHNGRFMIATGMLPKAPATLELMVKEQSLAVTWEKERSDEQESAIPTDSFIIRYRPIPNAERDGAFARASANEPFIELELKPSETSVILERNGTGDPLFDNCDYEVILGIKTMIGLSDWSTPAVGRTPRLPSVASRMIDFYDKNHEALSKTGQQGVKPWSIDESGGKKSLFLGQKTIVDRNCSNARFANDVAVRIVDVAAEFEASIPAADILDAQNTIVAIFTGTSGHGKSTEINAFVSYLLGGELEDSARVMMIDDRGTSQTSSVTQFVTCFRIRPFSPVFEGKTMLIVDTPGYGDTRGYDRDTFVTAAMKDFFSTVSHVNAIIFTCRAMESRTTFLTPVSTYVFQLFAKDVQNCLRTIYTFSDAGKPAAHDTLQKLGWPVQNGEISVNNSAFTVKPDTANASQIRDMWLFSTRGQFQVMVMLLKATPVSTNSSAEVTRDRIDLEQKCALAEQKIFKTAAEAQNLIANLDALAGAIGKAPDAEIPITEDQAVKRDLPEGKATTLCLVCNITCHEICMYSNDEDKQKCCAIQGENCTMCKGHCHWKDHHNATFIISLQKVTRMVVPEDMIKMWNTNSNTLEESLLSAIDEYLKLQQGLRNEMLELAKLTEKLMAKALLHNPSALLNYMDTLIAVATAQCYPTAQIVQLTTAKNTLLLLQKVKEQGTAASLESETLLDILGSVRIEMHRRMKLEMHERVREEKIPCRLYNTLREKLPPFIKDKAPAPLREKGMITKGELYPENLKAVVLLVKAVLKDGGIVAAIATQG
ncbi:hypothetical protein HYE68_003007 [Fusarium pseudograminearum]|nr:hypothetical protein HYE68_003007 [Fusarium pseudograminearum]